MRFAAPLSIAALALATLAASAQSPAPASSHAARQMAAPRASQTAAPTPPMGWNSWNYFHGNVTQKDIEAAADAMSTNGMKDAGYVYVNIDDTWQGTRNASGVLSANSKFPDMKALADYVHSKGLKLGIYSGPGPKTCAGYAGSYGHEQQDADLYASWGIDYLKYDLCSFDGIMQQTHPNDKAAQMQMMIAAYAKMDKALKSTGRPIVYSLCQYGWDAVWEWAPSVDGNLWRTTGDINPTWGRIYDILEEQAGLARYAGPGHWNDPDMLEVGNGIGGRFNGGRIRYLSLAEDRSHFSMWAMLAAPLLAGNDLATMQPDVLAILTNRDVIAIDQDRLGREATRAYADGEVEVWTRHLEHGALAIAVLNAGSPRYSSHPFHLSLTRLGLHGAQKGKDLWTGKEVTLTDNEPIELASHDILLIRIPAPKS
ncbi:MAG: glycoside hydrolase family 27 protein [Terracidiphilus sp.]